MPRRTGNRRTSNRRGWRLLAIASLAILAYFLFSFSGLVVTKARLDERLTSLRAEVATLKAESKELERELAWLQTDEALEKLAREELGWVKPGETGVVVLAPTPSPPPLGSSSVQLKVSRTPNWERWWSLFFGE